MVVMTDCFIMVICTLFVLLSDFITLGTASFYRPDALFVAKAVCTAAANIPRFIINAISKFNYKDVLTTSVHSSVHKRLQKPLF